MDVLQGIIGSVEAARILDVNPATVTRWAHDGILQPLHRRKRGKGVAFLFAAADVEALAASRANTGQ